LLVKLVVNGVTKFAIDMNGNIVIGGGGGGGGAATPTGSVLAFAGSAAPTGFLMCNGAAVSRTTYAALFGVIGTAYGAGDGVGTFNVPDMRQKFPLGKAAAGTGSTLGAAGGAIDHTHTGAAHTHTYTDVIDHTHAIGITDPTHEHLVHGIPAQSEFVAPFASGGTPHNFVWADNAGDYISPGPAATGITAAAASPAGAVATGTTASAGAGATSANNPPYLVTNYIIAQ
jgi:microcystin-dependent protein